ncbi:uncharacterized protein LOC128185469 [Crassostrea angulata]|uniref:uncharacterized protein LOC128185469 n=1 Tax=Magallana angulata TaxID=2784310 RepID=UPI0022B0E3AD|nr:uncharacterized protein LOC128185469 [Crassostrea angulata]
MVLVSLSPSEIFFSQDSISNHFGNYTPHGNKLIGETLDDILLGKCKVTDLPTIKVVEKRGLWVTADNRRLWVFKNLQILGECEKIVVENANTRRILARKKCVLRSIRVRGNEGGYLWRFRISNIHVTDKSECAIKPYAKSLDLESQEGTSLDSVSKKYHLEMECSTETIRSPIAEDALSENDIELVWKYTDEAPFSSKNQYKTTVNYFMSLQNECRTSERELNYVACSDKQTFLTPQENHDTSKEQDICDQEKDESCTFSNDIFQKKTCPSTFKQDRFIEAKNPQSSFNIGLYFQEHSTNVPKKCKDSNTIQATDQSTSADSNIFTSLGSFWEMSGKELNIATQSSSPVTPRFLENENTAKVSEKKYFEEKDAALTPATNKHQITPTNSYHAMSTKGLWQPSDIKLESGTESNKSISFSPLDNENTTTSIGQALHYQSKDKAGVRSSKNISEKTYVNTTQHDQYYGTVKSVKSESKEASFSGYTSENDIQSEELIRTLAEHPNQTGNSFYTSSLRDVCRPSRDMYETKNQSIKPTFVYPAEKKMTSTIAEHLHVTSPHKENISSITLRRKKDTEMNYPIKVNEDQIPDTRYHDLKPQSAIASSSNLLKKNTVALSREKGVFSEEKDKVARFFHKNKPEKDFISTVKHDSYPRTEQTEQQTLGRYSSYQKCKPDATSNADSSQTFTEDKKTLPLSFFPTSDKLGSEIKSMKSTWFCAIDNEATNISKGNLISHRNDAADSYLRETDSENSCLRSIKQDENDRTGQVEQPCDRKNSRYEEYSSDEAQSYDITSAPTKHQITRTNSYHLTSSRSLWQPSEKTLEFRTKSNKLTSSIPLDKEYAAKGTDQTRHSQRKDTDVGSRKNISEKTYENATKQNQCYGKEGSKKAGRTETSCCTLSSENGNKSREFTKTSEKDQIPSIDSYYIPSPRTVRHSSREKQEREVQSINPTFVSPPERKNTITKHHTISGTEEVTGTNLRKRDAEIDYPYTEKEDQIAETRYHHLKPQSNNNSGSSLLKKNTVATSKEKCPTYDERDTAAGYSRKSTSKKDCVSTMKHDSYPRTGQTEQQSLGRYSSYQKCESDASSNADSSQAFRENKKPLPLSFFPTSDELGSEIKSMESTSFCAIDNEATNISKGNLISYRNDAADSYLRETDSENSCLRSIKQDENDGTGQVEQPCDRKNSRYEEYSSEEAQSYDITSAPTKHQITRTNSYHLTSSRSLWQPSDRTLEFRTKSNKLTSPIPLDKEYAAKGTDQTRHSQRKDTDVGSRKNISEKPDENDTKQNQCYGKERSEKTHRTETICCTLSSENGNKSREFTKTSEKDQIPSMDSYYIPSPRTVRHSSREKQERKIQSINPTFVSPPERKNTITKHHTISGTEEVICTNLRKKDAEMDNPYTEKEDQIAETRYHHLKPQSDNNSGSSLLKKNTVATSKEKCPTYDERDTAAGYSCKSTSKKDCISTMKHDSYPRTGQTEQQSLGRYSSYQKCKPDATSNADSSQTFRENKKPLPLSFFPTSDELGSEIKSMESTSFCAIDNEDTNKLKGKGNLISHRNDAADSYLRETDSENSCLRSIKQDENDGTGQVEQPCDRKNSRYEDYSSEEAQSYGITSAPTKHQITRTNSYYLTSSRSLWQPSDRTLEFRTKSNKLTSSIPLDKEYAAKGTDQTRHSQRKDTDVGSRKNISEKTDKYATKQNQCYGKEGSKKAGRTETSCCTLSSENGNKSREFTKTSEKDQIPSIDPYYIPSRRTVRHSSREKQEREIQSIKPTFVSLPERKNTITKHHTIPGTEEYVSGSVTGTNLHKKDTEMEYPYTEKEDQIAETRYHHLKPQSDNNSGSSLLKKNTVATSKEKCPTYDERDTAAGYSRKSTSKKDCISTMKHDSYPSTGQTEQQSLGRYSSYRKCESDVRSNADSSPTFTKDQKMLSPSFNLTSDFLSANLMR